MWKNKKVLGFALFFIYIEFMLNFASDYTEGAHPSILEALTKTNFEQLSGYGSDKYCQRAKEKIARACNCHDAQVYFLSGGTQTNQIVIDTMLKPYEGVIAVQSGHVAVHEAGAIEATGHKVLTLPSHEGKMDSIELEEFIRNFYDDGNHEHMVFPGMVYISQPSEFGTVYSKNELKNISDICIKNKIPLYIDGARLGYALQSPDCDFTLSDIAKLCDVFYIGGTKTGALLGEALVFTKNNMPAHFDTQVKQHGALLAKGWVLGIQFDTLFTDQLYFKISQNAIDRAMELKDLFKKKGYKFYIDSPTNQQFIILDNKKMEGLSKQVAFCFWERYDESHTVVRFATSWATTKESIAQLAELL